MIKKFDFIERTIYLIRLELVKKLPKECTLDEMVKKLKDIIKELYN